MNSLLTFSEIKIGQKAEFKIVVNERLHHSFSQLSGDFSPIHGDDKFCSKTKFKKKIGYAFMLTAFLSRLYGKYLPGGSSICIKQEAKFIKPFFIGDRISVIGEVVNKIESTQFVEIKSEMHRNGKECIFKGNGVVQIIAKSKQALYKARNKKIYYSDFVKALKKVGINKGDVVFVHADIVFGKLAVLNKSLLLKNLFEAIKESIGSEGTIIMPTFSESFCKKEVYDMQKSRSIVGILTEYFRKQPQVKRTIHPILSAAVWGKRQKYFLNISKDCFDKQSIFGKLHQLKGKILFLGAPFQSCTFIHYIEQMHGIPYRYMKTFKGKIKNNNLEYQDTYTYFVRYLNKNVVSDFLKLEKHLLEKRLIKQVGLGSGKIMLVEAEILFQEGWKLLDQDIYFFLKEKPRGL